MLMKRFRREERQIEIRTYAFDMRKERPCGYATYLIHLLWQSANKHETLGCCCLIRSLCYTALVVQNQAQVYAQMRSRELTTVDSISAMVLRRCDTHT